MHIEKLLVANQNNKYIFVKIKINGIFFKINNTGRIKNKLKCLRALRIRASIKGKI